jgi:hypothetical protein
MRLVPVSPSQPSTTNHGRPTQNLFNSWIHTYSHHSSPLILVNRFEIYTGVRYRTKILIASVLLYVIAATSFLFGLLYVWTPKILPYHEVYLGMTHDQLPPRVAGLLLNALRLIGVLLMALGMAIGALTARPFARGERWSWWLILVCLVTVLLPLLFITLNIGWHTPWWLVIALLLLLLVAMVLSWPRKNSSGV